MLETIAGLRERVAALERQEFAILNRPGPVFNVRDPQFAAKGDGVTDDLAVLQSVATTIGTAGGGTMYIPGGTYAVTLSLNGGQHIIIPSNTHVVFAPDAVLDITAAASATGYRCLWVGDADNVRITGGTIIGDTSVAGVGEAGHGVWVGGGTNVIIEGLTSRNNRGDGLYIGGAAIRGTAAAGGASTITLAAGASAVDDYYNRRAIWIVSGTGVGQIRYITDYVGSTKVATVDRPWTTTPTSSSVYHVFQNTQVTVRDCTFRDNYRNNVSIVDAYDVTMENCRMYAALGTAPEAGIDIEPNTDNSVQRVTLRRCRADRNDGSGFLVEGVAGHVSDLVFEDCDASANGVHGWSMNKADTITLLGCRSVRNAQIGIALSSIHNAQITGGAANINGGAGVYLEGAYGASLAGVNILDNGDDGIDLRYLAADGYGRAYEQSVTGCYIRNNTGRGIDAQYVDNVMFANNRIYLNGNEGIRFNTTVNNCTIEGNQIVQNGQATDATHPGLYLNLLSHYNNIQGNTFRNALVWDAGTAQAGGASTITLATSSAGTDDYYNGQTVRITSGTGSGQSRVISDYVASTRVATVSTAWTTTPDNTSVYTVLGAMRPQAAAVIGSGCIKNNFINNDYLQGGAFSDGGTSTNTTAGNRAT